VSPRRLVLLGAVAIVAVFGLIQLIPSRITHPAARNEPPWDNPRTRQLAVAACFDCHSNQTRSFWYEKVAPVKWWIGSHVSEGRQRLNFSEWNSADNPGGNRAARTVRNGSMPPNYYTWLGLHGDAKLSTADRAALAAGLEKTLGTGAGNDGDRRGRRDRGDDG
jgi:hypothetical protein